MPHADCQRKSSLTQQRRNQQMMCIWNISLFNREQGLMLASYCHASQSSLFWTRILSGVLGWLLSDAALWPRAGRGTNTWSHCSEFRMLPVSAQVHAPHLYSWVFGEPLSDLLQTAETWNPAGAGRVRRTLRQLHHCHVHGGLHIWQTGHCAGGFSWTGSKYHSVPTLSLQRAAGPHLQTGGALRPVGAHSSPDILLPGFELRSLPPAQWHSGLAGFLQLLLLLDSAFEADAHRAHLVSVLWCPHSGSGGHHCPATTGGHPGSSTWQTGKSREGSWELGGWSQSTGYLKLFLLTLTFTHPCNLWLSWPSVLITVVLLLVFRARTFGRPCCPCSQADCY